ncbi:MAG: ATP-binding protein [Candidatus Protochlamydia sp.]|nr:ATP-binding protein [Candidatus Protochlamydia sp.]
MYIKRDIESRLKNDKGSYVQILIGPRQCGKSTEFALLGQGKFGEVTFDDMQARLLAERDPALFIAQYPPPILIDEVQYAPNIFPEIKRIVDQIKRIRLLKNDPEEIEVLFRLTGSNHILLDKNVKETLVGRASYFYMNTLTVHELKNAIPHLNLNQVLFQGGWPELYSNPLINPVNYLNNYILNYIEKDIVVSAGIVKKKEFHTVLGMLAARTANILNHSSLAKDSGVKSVTINEWISILERTQLLYLLPSVESNLNKRLIKSPKVYFLDTGLAARLQGWLDFNPMMKSPQAGALFETLVLSEIVKCNQNFAKNWKISMWRTKEGVEVDFIIENAKGDILALDAKLGIMGVDPIKIPISLTRTFPQLKQMVVVSYGGKKLMLSKECLQVPINDLTDFLLSF